MTTQPAPKTVLVIDDDKVFNQLVVKQLNSLGFSAKGTRSWVETKDYLEQKEPDVILLDVVLPDANGLELLPDLVATKPVIMLTAVGSIRTAVNAMKQGAAEYLVKPINLEELDIIIKRVLGHAELVEEMAFVRTHQREKRKSFMVGDSKALLKVNELIDAVATENVTVLITGESGVGKELVAREIHERSERTDKSFMALDCCTLQENLFESELFGHEKGAFTGADRLKKGLIEGAKGGTLFLDEIGEIGPGIQAKLLRVLETGIFRRLGGTKDFQSDARIISATNRNLEALSRDGSFRVDLYYRLAAFTIEVPPLRDRRDDIPALAAHFLMHHDFSRRINKKLTKQAMDMLVAYDWPGNVRELRNVIERAIIFSRDEGMIHPSHLGFAGDQLSIDHSVNMSFDHEPTLEEVKSDYIQRVVEKYNGNRLKIAMALGVSERNLYRLLKKLES
jgi:two-component system NtrC family response regulator